MESEQKARPAGGQQESTSGAFLWDAVAGACFSGYNR